ADALTRGAGVGRRQTRVIHNAVDMPTVDRAIARAEVRAELGLAAGTPIVLTVGRQTPAKNYPMFYRVAQSVTKDRPDVVFLAAGHGEPKDEAELAALRERMGLGQSMRMLGLRQDVPRLIASADVFCLCSRWEGFPNVLVEAMAGGLPAVCADFAGAREIADDNGRRICVLVDIDNDQQMTADILGLLSDTRRRAELGEAGRESVRRRFSWTRLLGRMDHLYTEFLGGPPGSR
ncbi:MAG TPA: glycosyltransferase, partial [Phycisphaerae bacterium]|nr:glycosyltransferase [Phycisphaerae bacterium]